MTSSDDDWRSVSVLLIPSPLSSPLSKSNTPSPIRSASSRAILRAVQDLSSPTSPLAKNSLNNDNTDTSPSRPRANSDLSAISRPLGPRVVQVKVVLVGDLGVGKTSLLLACDGKDPKRSYVPNVYECASREMEVKGKTLDVSTYATFYDPMCDESHSRLRPLTYHGADCFVILFAVNDRKSFGNTEDMWLPEILNFAGRRRPPLLLVGTRAEVRFDDEATACVSVREATILAQRICAEAYIETSAHLGENIIEFIECAVKVGLRHRLALEQERQDGIVEHLESKYHGRQAWQHATSLLKKRKPNIIKMVRLLQNANGKDGETPAAKADGVEDGAASSSGVHLNDASTLETSMAKDSVQSLDTTDTHPASKVASSCRCLIS